MTEFLFVEFEPIVVGHVSGTRFLLQFVATGDRLGRPEFKFSGVGGKDDVPDLDELVRNMESELQGEG